MKAILYLSIFIIAISLQCIAQISPNYIKIKEAPKNAESVVKEKNEYKIDIIGGGAFSSSATNSTAQTQAKGATGIAFYNGTTVQGNVIFNFGSNESVDFTDEETKGAALLIPGNTGQSLQFDYRHYNLFKKNNLGLYFSFIAAAGKWKNNDTVFNANTISSRLQISFLIIPPKEKKVNIMLTGDFGISYRGIFGDAASEKIFIESIFGNHKTNYIGTELNLDLWLNDVRLFFSFPYIFGEPVKGLTGGQLIIGASVSGKVLKDIFQ